MYYKNPFNYIGAKYKLLPQILPLFPDKIPILFDLFGGSGEVAFNAQADRVIYNEKNIPLVNIFNHLDDKFLDEVNAVIEHWKLTKTSKDEFLALREYYNNNLSSVCSRECGCALLLVDSRI